MTEIIIEDVKNIQVDISQLKDKSILITGASGLLGIYLLAFLKQFQKEYNIKIYTWNKSEIDDIFLPFFENCNTIISDIVDIKSFRNLPNFDFIIHAAGYGQPGKFMSDKMKTVELNTFSTKFLLEKLNIGGKFLFVSTSELYSGLDIDSVIESMIGTTNTDHPRACYIEGKRMGEAICHIYRESGLDVKIARLSLAYGPGTKIGDARVLNSVIEKSIKNNTITLMDAGDAIRTYCYITDVIEMLLNILFWSKDTIYNVGGISKLSILEMATKIGDCMNKNVEVPKNTSNLIGSPKNVNISIEKYCDEFSKIKFVNFDEGLEKTILWQKKLYNSL